MGHSFDRNEVLDRRWKVLATRLGVSTADAKGLYRGLRDSLEIPFGERFITREGMVRQWEKSDPHGTTLMKGRLPSGPGPGCRMHWRYMPTWVEPKNTTGGALRLHACHVLDHLLGKRVVGVRRTGRTRLLIIDLDAKTDRSKYELSNRYRRILAVLGKPAVVLRSSGTGGLHLYYFLRRGVQAEQLAEQIVGALKRARVRVQPGWTEVFPNGDQCIRLPLGKGCEVLRKDLRPVRTGSVAGTWRMFIEQAEHGRKRFEDLLRRSSRRKIPPQAGSVTVGRVAGTVTMRSTIPAPAILHEEAPPQKLRGRAYRDAVAAALKGVTQEGRRYQEFKLLLWHWTIKQGLSKEEALRQVKRWLKSGAHNSKDLINDPRGTRDRMFNDARRKIRRLLRYRKAHPFTPAGARPRPSSGAPSSTRYSSLSSLLHSMKDTHVRFWREEARQFLTAPDRDRLAGVSPRSLHAWLEVLVGLLRLAKLRTPALDRIALPFAVLKEITGGRPPPVTGIHVGGRGLTPQRSAPGLLVLAAKHLGYVYPTSARYIVGKQARIYRIKLPGTKAQ